MPSTLIDEYRKARKPYTGNYGDTGKEYVQVPRAVSALWQARAEIALRAAEDAGTIRFVWEHDDDYVPEHSGDTEHGDRWLAEEIAHLNDGSWEALGCRVQAPKTCPHCHLPLSDNAAARDYWGDYNADNEALPSLWGIVIDTADRHDYRREIERELAVESGIIEVPAVLV